MSAGSIRTASASNGRPLTRRQLVASAGAAAALAVTGAGAEGLFRRTRPLPRIRSYPSRATGKTHVFRSRPDLQPPAVEISGQEVGEAADHELGHRLLLLGPGPVNETPIAQSGPLIVDGDGEPVWFKPLPAGTVATNFIVSSYRGKPVLTWWEGQITTTGYGIGEGVVVDASYHEIARVKAANGRRMDMHEFRLTDRGTALFTCYPDTVPADLTPIGGPKRGHVLAPVIQEVELASGRLLMEWRSIEHVPIIDSYRPPHDPFDYLHINSVAPTPDGNLLVSGRHTWSLYKLERRTGKVLWRLGGKYPEFVLGPGAQFAWQHDAKQISKHTLTLFDNGSDGYTTTASRSRGLVLSLDERRGTVRLLKAYESATPLLASAMGSIQILDSGRVIVGWGSASQTSKFNQAGELLAESALPNGLFSYRSMVLPWQAAPHHAPSVAAARVPSTGAKLIYASLNGSTGLTGWQVQAGHRPDALQPVGIAKRRSFETVIPLHRAARYASVVAVDRSGRALGQSHAVAL